MSTTGDRILNYLSISHKLQHKGGGNYRCISPLRADATNKNNFSLLIEADGEHGAFTDFGGGGEVKGSLYELAHLLGIETPKGATQERKAPPPRPLAKPLKELPYYNSEWWSRLLNHATASEYLEGRGFQLPTMAAYELGYTGEDPLLQQWLANHSGKPLDQCKWAWHKIAIPRFYNGQVIGVKLRSLPHQATALKYVGLPNSDTSVPWNWHYSEVAVLFESELCASLFNQHTNTQYGMAVSAGAFKSNTAHYLAGVRWLFVAVDWDEAGVKHYQQIIRYYPHAKMLRPARGFKDFSEGYASGWLPAWVRDFEVEVNENGN